MTKHERIVRAFLAAMEEGDLATAAAYLAGQPEFVFPGNRRMNDLAAIDAAVGRRYRRIRKRIEMVDVAGSDAEAIVHVHGTLFGEWPDGTPFEGIRFIDRFRIEEGRIVSQMVWNDAGEAILARGKV